MNYHCPVCGELTTMVMNPEQAFCSNDSCVVFSFNPSLPDGGLSNAHPMQWTVKQLCRKCGTSIEFSGDFDPDRFDRMIEDHEGKCGLEDHNL